jgi:Ca2+/Na+ antiporter
MLRRVVWYNLTNISEVIIASIIRAIGSLLVEEINNVCFESDINQSFATFSN